MRDKYLPYCLPSIGEEEIQEVVESLRSGWITTGPKVKQFEEEFASYIGAPHAVAVSSCTAGLHTALAALGIGPGDEVIVPTMTFCATANVVAQLGALPVLVDVGEDFQISPEALWCALTEHTRAVIPVHYGGQPCDLDPILEIARNQNLFVVEDAAHAVGAEYQGRKIGVHGDAVVFSFYATKNLTTGEGGMVTTRDPELAERIRLFTLHGMTKDAWKRYSDAGSWFYDVSLAGYKYNMMDLQAAVGIHQLRRLDTLTERRRQIATAYDTAFADLPELVLPPKLPGRTHVYHLYPVQLRQSPGRDAGRLDRTTFIQQMAAARIGVSVHFIPLHRLTFYKNTYGYMRESFPVAESLYQGLVSLPLYPGMSDQDVEDVVEAVRTTVMRSRRHKGAISPKTRAAGL